MLKKYVTNPWLNMAVGIILVAAGLSEAIENMSAIAGDSFGAHHGAIVFGVVHTLKAFADAFEGSRGIEEIDTAATASE